MASSKKAAPKAATPVAPTSTAASREKDKEEPVPTFRVDLGESLPAQAPFPTGTDHKK